MNILILGGTGAMGVPLVQKLSDDKNNQIYVTSRHKRESHNTNIHFVQGNAHNLNMLNKLCSEYHFDAIVDFMIYGSAEFKQRIDSFLSKTDQYVFLSSCRVYANNNEIITENTPRLLDTVKDSAYLATDEYALRKAREEDMLRNSGRNNWTIIRPYITYNRNRLQLGTLEKEHWLRRALLHKTIVLTKKTAESITSLTYGEDVSNAIAAVIGNEKCYGQAFHIVNEESMTWKQVLLIYLDIFESVMGYRPKVQFLDDWQNFANVLGNQYQMKYDRFFNRKFDSSKIEKFTGEKINYKVIKEGLTECLTEFLEDQQATANMSTDWSYEGYVDRITGEHNRLADINGMKNKLKYIWWRCLPIKIVMLKIV
jgi:nucleoside-diphosphate-sugar epimerase